MCIYSVLTLSPAFLDPRSSSKWVLDRGMGYSESEVIHTSEGRPINLSSIADLYCLKALHLRPLLTVFRGKSRLLELLRGQRRLVTPLAVLFTRYCKRIPIRGRRASTTKLPVLRRWTMAEANGGGGSVVGSSLPVQFLETPEGRKLAYRRSEGSSPGVVFLHGLCSTMNGQKACALERLCQSQGHAFVAFDLSGHGQSSEKV